MSGIIMTTVEGGLNGPMGDEETDRIGPITTTEEGGLGVVVFPRNGGYEAEDNDDDDVHTGMFMSETRRDDSNDDVHTGGFTSMTSLTIHMT